VRQDNHQAGRLLVDKLMQLLDGFPAESATIETELIVRDT
jgi:DNA-binding LacI/PurR family transcriptional regulator